VQKDPFGAHLAPKNNQTGKENRSNTLQRILFCFFLWLGEQTFGDFYNENESSTQLLSSKSDGWPFSVKSQSLLYSQFIFIEVAANIADALWSAATAAAAAAAAVADADAGEELGLADPTSEFPLPQELMWPSSPPPLEVVLFPQWLGGDGTDPPPPAPGEFDAACWYLVMADP
jgi:hypothetical protein